MKTDDHSRSSEIRPGPVLRFVRGCAPAFGVVAALWIVDAIWLLSRPSAPIEPLATGLATALFASLAVAAPLGLALGAILAIAGPPAGEPWYRRLWSWLWVGPPERHHPRIAWLIATLFVGGVALGGAFSLSHRIVQSVVQHHFSALLIVAMNLGILIAGLLVLPTAVRFFRTIVAGFARVPVLSLALRRTLYPIAAFAIIGAGLSASVIVLFWRDVFVHMPWEPVLRILSAGALFVIGIIVLPVLLRRRWLRLFATVVVVAALTFATLFALNLEYRDFTARRIAFQDAMSGAVAYRVLILAADFDSDGHLSFLGGGDCDAHDPNRYPTAIDTPINGLDENCDGNDERSAVYRPLAIADHPIPPSVPTQPDVLLITIDAVAPPHLAMFGASRVVMPNLERFAESAALFTACYAQGPSTRLSIPALFTSRWDSQIQRVRSRRIPYGIAAEEQMLQEIIRDAGYQTVAVIPTRILDNRRWQGLLEGFETIDRSALSAGEHNAVEVTDAAIRNLQQRSDRPLYMWVHYFDAHGPYSAPEGAPDFGSREVDIYDAELAFVDGEVGRLLEASRDLSNPLIIIGSDHSTVFRSRPRSRHRYGYDIYSATLHVPLMIAADFVRVGRHDHLVSTLDIAPTLTNILRIPSPERFEGVSLVPELFHGITDRPSLAFEQYYLPEAVTRDEEPLRYVGIRTAEHHLVLNRRTGESELYAWRDDYYELENLVEAEGYDEQDIAVMLREQLDAYLEQVYVPQPLGTSPQ